MTWSNVVAEFALAHTVRPSPRPANSESARLAFVFIIFSYAWQSHILLRNISG
jgi:hypothetical protein